MRLIKSLLFVAAACLSFSISFAQSADEIISKHLAAIGGADNWKKVNSLKISGAIPLQGAELAVTNSLVNNVGYRSEYSVMGMTGYQIITLTEGWFFNPQQGSVEAMTADDVKESQDQLDAQNPLVDYAAKGHSVEYLGKEEVDGTECHKLKVIYKSGRSETMYFDPSNFYLLKTVTIKKADGQEAEISIIFSNYENLPEGIVIAKVWSGNLLGPGMNVELNISKVEVNASIDPSTFKPSK